MLWKNGRLITILLMNAFKVSCAISQLKLFYKLAAWIKLTTTKGTSVGKIWIID